MKPDKVKKEAIRLKEIAADIRLIEQLLDRRKAEGKKQGRILAENIREMLEKEYIDMHMRDRACMCFACFLKSYHAKNVALEDELIPRIARCLLTREEFTLRMGGHNKTFYDSDSVQRFYKRGYFRAGRILANLLRGIGLDCKMQSVKSLFWGSVYLDLHVWAKRKKTGEADDRAGRRDRTAKKAA
jgi:hypothetical protein